MITRPARLIYQVFELSSNKVGHAVLSPLEAFSKLESAQIFVRDFNKEARKEGRNDEYFVRPIVFYDEQEDE